NTKLALLVRATALLLCFLISQAASTSHAQASVSEDCLSSERDALLSFKASLLDPAGHLSSWRHGNNCCQWRPVSSLAGSTGEPLMLAARGLRIESLDLAWNMTNLSVLRASGNMMAGPLPVGVRALGNLKELDLGYNNFNGVLLKDHFTSLGNLESLRVSYNNF
uniref:Leucine-rich repeat-containing N-terminal plant-type domain-containing protein n=1 Tax=Aegilops tauschii subsp. strangulata TaxID=200361 RepID=A0A453TEA2_AEGTS